MDMCCRLVELFSPAVHDLLQVIYNCLHLTLHVITATGSTPYILQQDILQQTLTRPSSNSTLGFRYLGNTFILTFRRTYIFTSEPIIISFELSLGWTVRDFS